MKPSRSGPSSGILGPVRRTLTTGLLLLALTGIVSGNLLWPCDCDSSEDGDAHALCQSWSATHKPPASCCGCGSERPEEEGGCTLCCKPRPPLTEAAEAVQLADARVVGIATVAELPSSAAAPARQHVRLLVRERRTSDPWLLSPEGLAVFLI